METHIYRLETLWRNGNRTSDYFIEESKAFDSYRLDTKYPSEGAREISLFVVAMKDGFGVETCRRKWDSQKGEC